MKTGWRAQPPAALAADGGWRRFGRRSAQRGRSARAIYGRIKSLRQARRLRETGRRFVNERSRQRRRGGGGGGGLAAGGGGTPAVMTDGRGKLAVGGRAGGLCGAGRGAERHFAGIRQSDLGGEQQRQQGLYGHGQAAEQAGRQAILARPRPHGANLSQGCSRRHAANYWLTRD